jgi:phosphoribosylformylglycinamidine synthase
MEANLAEVLHEAAREGWIHSAHDVSSGGLVTNLAESCLAGDLGVTFDADEGVDARQMLFSESPGRVVVTVPSRHVLAFAQLCEDARVPLRDAGTVGGRRLEIEDLVDVTLDELRRAHEGGLPIALDDR